MQHAKSDNLTCSKCDITYIDFLLHAALASLLKLSSLTNGLSMAAAIVICFLLSSGIRDFEFAPLGWDSDDVLLDEVVEISGTSLLKLDLVWDSGGTFIVDGGLNLKARFEIEEFELEPNGKEFPSADVMDLESCECVHGSWDAFILRPPNLSVKSCENWDDEYWLESSWDISKWLGSLSMFSELLFPNIAKNLPRFLRFSGELITARFFLYESWSRGVHSLW